MFDLFALLVAAVADPTESAAPSKTCQSLAADFDSNEYGMAIMHDLNVKLHKTDLEFVGVMGPAQARQAEVSAAKIKETDEEYLAKADRILTLMLAHKCSPPDHVTSYFTYSETNPNRKIYRPPPKQK